MVAENYEQTDTHTHGATTVILAASAKAGKLSSMSRENFKCCQVCKGFAASVGAYVLVVPDAAGQSYISVSVTYIQ